MKKWEKPDMRVFRVKMNENIASSGGGEYNISNIDYDLGGITRGGAAYRWNGNNNIQDTGICFTDTGFEKVIPESDVGRVAGCLA